MESARRLQFGGAFRTSAQVLLQFVTSVIGELVINVQQNIFLYPFTLHKCTLSGVPPNKNFAGYPHRRSASAPRSFCVAPEERVLGRLFRGMQNFSHGPQLQPVVMLQLKNHALPGRQLIKSAVNPRPSWRRIRSRSGFAPARPSGTWSSRLYSSPEASVLTGASSLRTWRLRR